MNSYLQMILKSVQQTNHPRSGDNCTVLAFTSSLPGEGVSFVASSFGLELARKTRRRTLIADLNTLQQLDLYHYSRVSKFCYQTTVKNLFVLPPEEQLPVEEEEEEESFTHLKLRRAESEFDRGLNNIQTLRYLFDFVLIDCPSLKESGDAALFSEAVNGVVVVVEADSTRREQVRNAIQTIERAEGNLIGCVLNKRQYPIPNWLYRRI